MKYPRYHWRDDRRRKLTPFQISTVKIWYSKGGLSQKEIGEIMGVSQARVHQILLPLQEQKLRNRLYYKRYRFCYFKIDKKKRKEYRHRKRSIQKRKIRLYYKERCRVCRRRINDEAK